MNLKLLPLKKKIKLTFIGLLKLKKKKISFFFSFINFNYWIKIKGLYFFFLFRYKIICRITGWSKWNIEQINLVALKFVLLNFVIQLLSCFFLFLTLLLLNFTNVNCIVVEKSYHFFLSFLLNIIPIMWPNSADIIYWYTTRIMTVCSVFFCGFVSSDYNRWVSLW